MNAKPRAVPWRAMDCPTCHATRRELCRVLDDDGLPTGSVKTQPHAARVLAAQRAVTGASNRT